MLFICIFAPGKKVEDGMARFEKQFVISLVHTLTSSIACGDGRKISAVIFTDRYSRRSGYSSYCRANFP